MLPLPDGVAVTTTPLRAVTVGVDGAATKPLPVPGGVTEVLAVKFVSFKTLPVMLPIK